MQWIQEHTESRLKWLTLLGIHILFLFIPCLQAGPSASHRIRIVIRQPNFITLDQTAESDPEYQHAMESGSAFRLRWLTDLHKKRLTVSTESKEKTDQYILINHDKKIRLTEAPQEVTDTLNTREGECSVGFLGNIDRSEPFQLVYTLTDY